MLVSVAGFLRYTSLDYNFNMEQRNTQPMETIPQFFTGKNIFITGGSGFMGKALIEKLLRTCPDIGNIYLLMRPKYGVECTARIKKMTDDVLFDTVRQYGTAIFKKLIIIEGDIKEIGLGLSEESLYTLVQNVSIVYHVAATVRFNTSLTDAVLINARGTREVCKLMLKLEDPQMLIHFSTAYCHPDERNMEEELYPPHANWKDVISIVESMDEPKLNLLTSKYAEGFPNTYTFSKSLAENIVVEMCEKKIPTIIFRPTIVVPTYKEPIRGWCDSMNGAVGVVAAIGKGVVRSIYLSNMNARNDFVPVDIAIDRIVIATWIERKNYEYVSVYNGSNNQILLLTTGEFKKIGEAVKDVVPTFMYWYPSTFVTSNKFVHLLHVYFLHLLTGTLVDTILWACNKKQKLMRIHKLMAVLAPSIEFFFTREWNFANKKFLDVDDHLLPEDRGLFGINFDEIDARHQFIGGAKYCYEHLLKEDPKDHDFYTAYSKVLWVLNSILKTTVAVYLCLFIYNSIIVPYSERYYNYVLHL